MSLEILTLIIGVLAIAIAVAIWLTRLMDHRCHEQIVEIRKQMHSELIEVKRDLAFRHTQEIKDRLNLHDRINTVKDTYCRISDHDKDISRLQAAVTDTRIELRLDHDKLVDLALLSSPKSPIQSHTHQVARESHS